MQEVVTTASVGGQDHTLQRNAHKLGRKPFRVPEFQRVLDHILAKRATDAVDDPSIPNGVTQLPEECTILNWQRNAELALHLSHFMLGGPILREPGFWGRADLPAQATYRIHMDSSQAHRSADPSNWLDDGHEGLTRSPQTTDQRIPRKLEQRPPLQPRCREGGPIHMEQLCCNQVLSDCPNHRLR